MQSRVLRFRPACRISGPPAAFQTRLLHFRPARCNSDPPAAFQTRLLHFRPPAAIQADHWWPHAVGTYQFQVRALGKLGYTDWSPSMTFISA